jgi:hypothetical protein
VPFFTSNYSYRCIACSTPIIASAMATANKDMECADPTVLAQYTKQGSDNFEALVHRMKDVSDEMLILPSSSLPNPIHNPLSLRLLNNICSFARFLFFLTKMLLFFFSFLLTLYSLTCSYTVTFFLTGPSKSHARHRKEHHPGPSGFQQSGWPRHI